MTRRDDNVSGQDLQLQYHVLCRSRSLTRLGVVKCNSISALGTFPGGGVRYMEKITALRRLFRTAGNSHYVQGIK